MIFRFETKFQLPAKPIRQYPRFQAKNHISAKKFQKNKKKLLLGLTNGRRHEGCSPVVGVHHECGRGGRRLRHRVDDCGGRDGRRQRRRIRPPRRQQHPQVVSLLVLLLVVLLLLLGRLRCLLGSSAGRGASLSGDCYAYRDSRH